MSTGATLLVFVLAATVSFFIAIRIDWWKKTQSISRANRFARPNDISLRQWYWPLIIPIFLFVDLTEGLIFHSHAVGVELNGFIEAFIKFSVALIAFYPCWLIYRRVRKGATISAPIQWAKLGPFYLAVLACIWVIYNLFGRPYFSTIISLVK